MNNIGMLMGARNPQEFLQKAMQNNQLMQNPIMQNTMSMMQKGDTKGLEETARNLLKEQGLDADEVLKQVKSQFGM